MKAAISGEEIPFETFGGAFEAHRLNLLAHDGLRRTSIASEITGQRHRCVAAICLHRGAGPRIVPP